MKVEWRLGPRLLAGPRPVPLSNGTLLIQTSAGGFFYGLTAVGDTSSAGTLGGDAVCLLSAALYAVYTVAIRMRAPDDLALFFGLLGAFNAVIFAPLVLVLHFTGAEDLGALSWEIGGLLVGKGLVDNVLSDYLWAQAVLLTSPTNLQKSLTASTGGSVASAAATCDRLRTPAAKSDDPLADAA